MSPSDIEIMYCDTNVPSFNMAFRERGYQVLEADKTAGTVIGGIDVLKKLIGEGRININENSLQSRCPYFDGLQGWKEEVGAYAYHDKDKQLTLKEPDLPVDTHNHWCDAKRYLCYGQEGQQMKAEPSDPLDVEWTY